MLELVFEKEIARILGKKLSDGDMQRAIEVIRQSPYMPQRAKKWYHRFTVGLGRILGAHETTELTAGEFLQRLSRTEIGTALAEKFADKKDELEKELEKIEARYDEIAASASEWMKNSSAVLSLIIGLGLAFVANIDGYRIYAFYVENPDRAAAVADSKKAAGHLKSYAAAEAGFKKALQDLETVAVGESSKAEARKVVEEVQTTVAEIRKTADALMGAGVPMGWGYYPHCQFWLIGGDTAKDTECGEPPTWPRFFWLLVTWLPMTFLTGILIGLGGPFWYDAVTGLMRVTQVLRAGVAPPAPQPAPAGPAAADGAAKKTPKGDLFEDRKDEKDAVDGGKIETGLK